VTALALAHQRRFGVEIECGNERGYQSVGEQLRAAGYNPLSVGSDGSGVEVRTRILQGQEGFSELKSMMGFLREIGSYVTQSDGMHVHHDCPELVTDPSKTLQVVKSWVANRRNIDPFVAPARRDRSPWSSESVRRLEAICMGTTTVTEPNPYYRPGSRYADEREPSITRVIAPRGRGMTGFGRNDLNISSLREHGTIEIRIHEGSLDGDQAEAWIKMCQRFLHDSIKRARPMPGAPDREVLLNRLRLSKSARAVLAAKIAAGEYPAQRVRY
jgi:hypothetical protein